MECSNQLAQQSSANNVSTSSTQRSLSCPARESMRMIVYQTHKHGATLQPCLRPLVGMKSAAQSPAL